MRAPGKALALLTLAALFGGAWAMGCTGLSSDCELNLNCAPTEDPVTCEDPIFFYAPCDTCMQEKCCAAFGACEADSTCQNYCVFGLAPYPPECQGGNTKERLDAFGACMTGECASACVKDQCNPVVGTSCPPDMACDVGYPGMFVCAGFPPGAILAGLCEQCDNLESPYCGPGLRCHVGSGTCARYCCNDTDCGTGRCELDPLKAFGAPLAIPGDNVGICVTMDGAAAACDAPAVPTSGGTCVAGFPPM